MDYKPIAVAAVVTWVFMTRFVSLGSYGTLNIDARLGVLASIAAFVEMLLVGAVIGVMYRPAAHRAPVRAAGV